MSRKPTAGSEDVDRHETAAPIRPVRRRMSPERRKAMLLDHAGQILVESGIEALTMAGLAKHAGVNKSLVYYYFGSREGVLIALLEREHWSIFNESSRVLDNNHDFLDQLYALAQLFLRRTEQESLLTVLESVRTESGEFESRVAQAHFASILFIAATIQQNFNLDADTAILTAGALNASMMGFTAAWRATSYSEEDAIALWIELFIGAVTRVAERCVREVRPDIEVSGVPGGGQGDGHHVSIDC